MFRIRRNPLTAGDLAGSEEQQTDDISSLLDWRFADLLRSADVAQTPRHEEENETHEEEPPRAARFI